MVEYADYEFYTKEFHGNTIPEVAFPSVILRASIFVKYVTTGKIEDIEIPEEARMAACAVAEVMYRADAEGQQEKKSETVGNVSVSYVTEQQDGQVRETAMAKKQYAAAYPYLIHTGLLYRGCR